MRQIPDTALLIGDRGDIRSPSAVRRRGVQAVVDLAMEEPPFVMDREMSILRIPLTDGGGNSRAMLALAVRTVAELLRTATPALVVCSAGLSRSPTIAAAALSVSRQITPDTALAIIRSAGPADVSPMLWSAVLEAMKTNVANGFLAL